MQQRLPAGLGGQLTGQGHVPRMVASSEKASRPGVPLQVGELTWAAWEAPPVGKGTPVPLPPLGDRQGPLPNSGQPLPPHMPLLNLRATLEA